MKLAAFDHHRIGIVENDRIYDITSALPAALDLLPAQRMNWLIANWDNLQVAIRAARAATQGVALGSVRLLAANPAPPQIFAAPANYAKHIGELGARTVTKRSAREQGFFLKAAGSVLGSGGTIELPGGSKRRFDHECELAVIIGKRAWHVPRAKALDYVFGYSCLIDATMRIEPGEFEEERTMRKSFAGFTPIGPWIVTADEIPNPQNLNSRLWVNGNLRQEANTRDMIVGVAELIELISSAVPLNPGDVIASGTPEGVGPFVPGDELRITIDGVGTMNVHIREGARPPRPF